MNNRRQFLKNSTFLGVGSCFLPILAFNFSDRWKFGKYQFTAKGLKIENDLWTFTTQNETIKILWKVKGNEPYGAIKDKNGWKKVKMLDVSFNIPRRDMNVFGELRCISKVETDDISVNLEFEMA